jgi:hypothetical protein
MYTESMSKYALKIAMYGQIFSINETRPFIDRFYNLDVYCKDAMH